MKPLLLLAVLFLMINNATGQNPKRNPQPKLPPAVIFAGHTDVNSNGNDVYASNDATVLISDDYIVYNGKVVNSKTGEMKGDTLFFTGVKGLAIRSTILSYQNSRYPMPAINCDSLKKLCYKTGSSGGMAITIFYGNVYSNLVQRLTEIKGAVNQKMFDQTSSLLMTRGWVFDCAKGTAELQVFFQYMQSGTGGETSVRFSRTISTNVICH